MKMMKVRFPNEPHQIPVRVNVEEFKVDREFDDEVFGWLGEQYVAINKGDYDQGKGSK